jgi:hypothetical protein
VAYNFLNTDAITEYTETTQCQEPYFFLKEAEYGSFSTNEIARNLEEKKIPVHL